MPHHCVLYVANDLTTSNNTRFNFSYDTSTQKYGYKDSNNEFVPFEQGQDTSDGTITSSTVLANYVGYSQGQRIVGSIASRSASSQTVSGSVTYQAGYYPSNWTVTGLDTSDATAYAKNIEMGYSAYCRGTKIAGTATIPHEILKYNGTISDLSEPKSTQYLKSHVESGIGDYAVILSMYGGSCDAYNSSLTRILAGGVDRFSNVVGCISNVNYLVAYSDQYSDSQSYLIGKGSVYNSSLVQTIVRDFGTPGSGGKLTANNEYFIVAGGYGYFGSSDYAYYNNARAMNNSFTVQNLQTLKTGGTISTGTKIGDYAIYSVVTNDGNKKGDTWTYNLSLTRQYLSDPSYLYIGYSAYNNIYALTGGNGRAFLYDTNLVRYEIQDCYVEEDTISLGTNFLYGRGMYCLNSSQTISNTNVNHPYGNGIPAKNPNYSILAGGGTTFGADQLRSVVSAFYES